MPLGRPRRPSDLPCLRRNKESGLSRPAVLAGGPAGNEVWLRQKDTYNYEDESHFHLHSVNSDWTPVLLLPDSICPVTTDITVSCVNSVTLCVERIFVLRGVLGGPPDSTWKLTAIFLRRQPPFHLNLTPAFLVGTS